MQLFDIYDKIVLAKTILEKKTLTSYAIHHETNHFYKITHNSKILTKRYTLNDKL
jgi:hypothetical protein